jgi:hypothetical protein
MDDSRLIFGLTAFQMMSDPPIDRTRIEEQGDDW